MLSVLLCRGKKKRGTSANCSSLQVVRALVNLPVFPKKRQKWVFSYEILHYFFLATSSQRTPEDREKYSHWKAYICNSFATYSSLILVRRRIFFLTQGSGKSTKREFYNWIVPSYVKTGSALIILIFVQRGYFCFTIFREKNKTARKSFSSIKERQGAVMSIWARLRFCHMSISFLPPSLKRLSTQVEATLSNSDPRTHETRLKRRKIVSH